MRHFLLALLRRIASLSSPVLTSWFLQVTSYLLSFLFLPVEILSWSKLDSSERTSGETLLKLALIHLAHTISMYHWTYQLLAGIRGSLGRVDFGVDKSNTDMASEIKSGLLCLPVL